MSIGERARRGRGARERRARPRRTQTCSGTDVAWSWASMCSLPGLLAGLCGGGEIMGILHTWREGERSAVAVARREGATAVVRLSMAMQVAMTSCSTAPASGCGVSRGAAHAKERREGRPGAVCQVGGGQVWFEPARCSTKWPQEKKLNFSNLKPGLCLAMTRVSPSNLAGQGELICVVFK